jgi:PAS domain S-box-containing protein
MILNSTEKGLKAFLKIPAVAFSLAGFSIICALSIGFITYQSSLTETERKYREFYLREAQLIVKIAEIRKQAFDDDILKAIRQTWESLEGRPSDEYLCIVDKDSRLTLHTADPNSVGKYVGENLLKGQGEKPIHRLHDLVESPREYVGDYMSSAGQKQVAAFVFAPGKKWMIGLHRSKEALMKNVEQGIRFSKYGFLLICGLLMPLSWILIYLAFHGAQKKRLQAEIGLRESEKRYRVLFEQAPDAIFIEDMQDRIIDVNPAGCELMGYTRDEILGMTVPYLQAPEARGREGTVVRGEFEKYRGAAFEALNLHKDGTRISVEIRTVPLSREGQFLSIVRDISDRRYMESEKKKLEIQLQQAQKMESIGTLAGGIAHDFNNILSAVMGYTELALNDAEPGSTLHSRLHEVYQAGARAVELVKQILTFSRQTEQGHKPVQVKLIVKEALKFLRATLPTTLEIRQDIRSDSLAMADPTQIHQVLMNLCTNAEHAMRDKGGVLTVRLSDVKIDEKLSAELPELNPGNYIELAVSDSGRGISPTIQNRIFDPFFTTKEKGEGTGMGLAVVHGIVGSCGGAITVDSEAGEGSTFSVYLPIIQKQKADRARDEGPVPTGTERILFVDDEPALVNIGKLTLESLGYQVTTRTSGMEALELFKAKPRDFDLVITDMTMPNMAGDDLARELMQINPQIPIILCTGYSTRIDKQKAAEIGIRAFVSKPVLRKDIAESIRKALA